MDYLTTAESIFYWLTQYQISQRQIVARREKEEINFTLEHPIEGNIEVKEPLPEGKNFRSHGVGLRIIQKDKQKVVLEVYDHGGIFDPIDYSIPGDHYATTHFALLGAILFRERQQEDLLERVRKAIDFHLRTSKDEYYFGTWGYHWDFQNYAFLETYRLVNGFLSNEETKRWIKGLKSYRENSKNFLTNWIAMRAYSSLLRHKLFGTPVDKLKFMWRIRRVDKAQHSDGCYDDQRNFSRPIQYHVFTLALLHRLYDLTRSEKIKKHFLAGVNYFTKFIDPDGCFNYLGRGQEQIFGYGVAIYVLEAAKLVDKTKAPEYQDYLSRVWSYLCKFKRDGHFPLVLNDRKDEEKFGWYDYHHLTVYNAFLGAWLGLSHLLGAKDSQRKNAKQQRPQEVVLCKPTETAFISNDKLFCCLYGGLPEYLSEAGVTFQHLWFRDIGWVFSCPGGPSPKIYGKFTSVANVEKNYFAPLAQDKVGRWIIPAHRKGSVQQLKPNLVQVDLDYGSFRVKRKVQILESKLLVEDEMEFSQDTRFNEFRYFNFPVVIDKFEIDWNEKNPHELQLRSMGGTVRFEFKHNDFGKAVFERLEEIKTTKGLTQVVAFRKNDFQVKAGQHKKIVFSISRGNETI